MTKEIKYTGFTATPSDYECPDGELDAAINLVPEDGELKPVQEGVEKDKLADDEEVLLVHVVNDGKKHLIIKNGYSLGYRELGAEDKTVNPIKTFDTDTFKCSATGNVLCVYGLGAMEHFIFLYGTYRAFTPDKYAVNVLFGITASTQTGGGTIDRMLVEGGQGHYTWDNILSQHLYKSGSTSGTDININLEAQKTYRIRLTPDDGSGVTCYNRITLWSSGGTWQALNMGISRSFFTFATEFDVVRIHIAYYSDSNYSHIYTQRFYFQLDIDEAIEEVEPGDVPPYSYNPHHQVNEALLGYVNQLFGNIRNHNKFALPFFVRYGFRLITGEVITVSPPILIEPNTGTVPIVTISNVAEAQGGTYYNATATLTINEATLKYRVRDLDKLQAIIDSDDMVDSLVIAISDPIYLYKQGATDAECAEEIYLSNNMVEDSKCYAITGVAPLAPVADYYLKLPSYSKYYSKVTSVSNFKVVAEIRKDNISTSESFVEVPIKEYALNGLAGNMDLLEDNVEQLNSYDSNFVKSYNQREHWLGVTETIFGGFDLDIMCGYVGGTAHNTNYSVGYRSEDSTGLQYIVRGKREESSINRRWFYFPSTRAIDATIYENSKAYPIVLTKHETLTGAFHFEDIGEGQSDTEGGIDREAVRLSSIKQNMMYVSAQANPIVIDQRERVGDGVLLAAETNTVALAQEDFGNSPLYIFSTDGVWAVEVDKDGTYSVRKAVSRDVCNNINSITKLDNAVIFTTERGIMLLSGSDSICITDSIMSDSAFHLVGSNGLLPKLERLESTFPIVGTAADIVPFKTFLLGARMLYDYVHQRIICYNHEKDYAYIYSLKSKMWGMMESNILYGINSYPECLAVDGDRNIVDLSSLDGNSDTSNSSTSHVKTLIITRPLKLDAPDILKTIDTIIQRGQFRKGSVQSILYGSRDLFNWQLVYSSKDHYLRGFRGTPYKYFRIVLLANLQKDESIFGCTIGYTPRLLDQLR